ncbi:hypothetical protein AQUCO_01100026v1 [Aquilegia coerulea]|uniref:Uncharacterized protein n=1 Tax=Aquilegia coerulea TaxID=218851 RepID=A0A2G5E596_AQUCA|nr:hypothetical protein AQUCO_01100026v1 [Aquilegia coerulea]
MRSQHGYQDRLQNIIRTNSIYIQYSSFLKPIPSLEQNQAILTASTPPKPYSMSSVIHWNPVNNTIIPALNVKQLQPIILSDKVDNNSICFTAINTTIVRRR